MLQHHSCIAREGRLLICGIRVHYPYDTAPKIQRSAQEFVYRIQKGNVPAVNEVILHEGFKMIAPSDVRSLNSLTCRTVQIMSRVTGKQKKRKNPEGLPFPPLLGALKFTPVGVDRISTDVHKSRRSSTKQQANQQLHTRNPRNNKERHPRSWRQRRICPASPCASAVAP